MRLLLLPISTRRALIYCDPASLSVSKAGPSYFDKGIQKATGLWAKWEKAESGWQKSVTSYGNQLLRRIPFEEWGLKSLPPLDQRRKDKYSQQPKSDVQVEVRYPRLYHALGREGILDTLKRIGTERKDLHKKRLIWSVVGMPITAPFALLPVIPNLPFFYLVFRAYSHYRAWSGSIHLSYLTDNNLLKPVADNHIDSLYSAGLLHANREDSMNAPDPSTAQNEVITELVRKQMGQNTEIESAKSDAADASKEQSETGRRPEHEEIMLLRRWNGKLIAERLGLPGLQLEIERAVEQVEKDLKNEEQNKKQGQHTEPKITASTLEPEENKKSTLEEKK